MSLQILTNTVFRDCAQLKVTDTAEVATTDTTGLENVTGGQRWQYWTSGTTADRRIAYINKNGGLACSHVVLTRADLHQNHQIQIHSWSNYTSSATTEYDSGASFAPTLIGPFAQDYVWDLTAASITNKQAMTMAFVAGTGGAYTKKVHQLYFSSALTLNYPGSITIERQKFPTMYLYDRQSYLVDSEFQILAASLTEAEVNTFNNLYMLQRRPIFIYDSAGTLITFKLLHCIIKDFKVVESFHDTYDVQLDVLSLRQWT